MLSALMNFRTHHCHAHAVRTVGEQELDSPPPCPLRLDSEVGLPEGSEKLTSSGDLRGAGVGGDQR